MAYYVMVCKGVYPSAVIDHGPDIGQAPWNHGGKVGVEFPLPLVYVLEAQPGNIKKMYAAADYPVMADDLCEALRAAGVDNLQLFDAVIDDPVTGMRHTGFKAFNILGAVAAADMAKSVLMGTSDSKIIDVDFESLAIDPSKAGPFKMFRLAESVSAIIVNEAVRKGIESRKIPGMQFYDPEDWSG